MNQVEYAQQVQVQVPGVGVVVPEELPGEQVRLPDRLRDPVPVRCQVDGPNVRCQVDGAWPGVMCQKKR